MWGGYTAVMKMSLVARIVAVVAVMGLGVRQSVAWGADGHRMINRLASAMLPKEVPEFLRDAGGAESNGVLRAGAGPLERAGGAGAECGWVAGTLYRSWSTRT